MISWAVVAACGSRSVPPSAPMQRVTSCPSSLVSALPRGVVSWLFVRPRALFEHPRLGAILDRAVDSAGERALIHRAGRTGYDVRTLDRVVIGWTDRGTVYLGAGSLDGRHIVSRLWDRLLSPRRRVRDRAGNERIEGVLGDTFVSALLRPACGVAAYAEGEASAAVDRIMVAQSGRDPEALVVWHTRRVPESLAQGGGRALVHSVRELEVRVSPSMDGVRVTLSLEGPLPADAAVRLRRVVAAVVDSPLGELIGATQWLIPERLEVQERSGMLMAAVAVPWRALMGLAEVLRGEVGGPPAP